jgi:hypothetical protein
MHVLVTLRGRDVEIWVMVATDGSAARANS